MISIVNYGLGNIQAIANIYKRLGVPVQIASNEEELAEARRIILPGVGSFDWPQCAPVSGRDARRQTFPGG